MLISVKHGHVKIVSKALLKHPEIIDLSEVFGRYDIIIKVEVENTEELQKFYQNKINIIEGIIRIESLIALENDYNETFETTSSTQEEQEIDDVTHSDEEDYTEDN